MNLDASGGQDGALMPEAIGHYRVVRRLGGGGFGDVDEAHDLERDRVVAVKVPSAPSPLADIEFKTEVRMVVDLAPPRLLTPFEMLESDGRLAVAMPRVRGVDFVSSIRGDAFPEWNEAREARLFSAPGQLLQALGALHRRGLLHLLSQRGATARAAGVRGTPAYAAPEQLMGGPARETSDWYAVGVMPSEALTGRRPFPDPARTRFFVSTFEDAPSADSFMEALPVVCLIISPEPERSPTQD